MGIDYSATGDRSREERCRSLHGVGNTSGKIWVSDPDGGKLPAAGETKGRDVAYDDFVSSWKSSAAVFSWESASGGSGSADPKSKQ